MKVINLTPHDLNLYKGGECVETIKSEGFARAEQVNTHIGNINGYPLSKVTYGEAENMPEPKSGAIYVVSSITAQALKHRNDVVTPTGMVRDENGRIIGCTGFAKL
jgi:glucose-6-phosphate dehydrogenase assembly protein OpcA